MVVRVGIILKSLCLLLISVTLGAVDYKNWLPLVPQALGSLARSGEPNGINMEMNG